MPRVKFIEVDLAILIFIAQQSKGPIFLAFISQLI